MTAFRAFPKIPRLFRPVTITEKIDGTNGAVVISEDGTVGAQSRTRPLPMGPRGMDDRDWESDDNHGFAAWVREHAAALAGLLGPGCHFGEWWGYKINRSYGLEKGDRRFSLFNVGRWGHLAEPDQQAGVPGLGVVPIVAELEFIDLDSIDQLLWELKDNGSHAAPGFMDPEGLVVYHKAANQPFKITVKDDWLPKSSAQPLQAAA